MRVKFPGTAAANLRRTFHFSSVGTHFRIFLHCTQQLLKIWILIPLELEDRARFGWLLDDEEEFHAPEVSRDGVVNIDISPRRSIQIAKPKTQISIGRLSSLQHQVRTVRDKLSETTVRQVTRNGSIRCKQIHLLPATCREREEAHGGFERKCNCIGGCEAHG